MGMCVLKVAESYFDEYASVKIRRCVPFLAQERK